MKLRSCAQISDKVADKIVERAIKFVGDIAGRFSIEKSWKIAEIRNRVFAC